MSLTPLNELKRRLQDDSTPLPKRLCLAKNVVQSYHFPTAPKERIVGDWLETLTQKNELNSIEFKNILKWSMAFDLTNELKTKLIQVISEYVDKSPITNDVIHAVLLFIENEKMSPQLSLHPEKYLHITITLLQHLKDDSLTFVTIQRILNNMIKYYKESKKKLEFIIKLINGENLDILFNYLHTECRDTVIKVCRNIIFPMNKKTFFANFLHSLIRKQNIDNILAEKGDNMQSVLKIMGVFFRFPNCLTKKSHEFLSNFISAFVSSFSTESQMIFAFYVMVVNVLDMNQSYLTPATKLSPIMFEENEDKIKRHIFLNMLEALLKNEVDVNVRFTDTFGEKISKVEMKKNFLTFLQVTMMGQLKLEGKMDKLTLQIIKTALKLDPSLIEQKFNNILPPIMTVKKGKNIIESYKEMMNYLLEILFKLSRGISFLNEILPNIRLSLEATNSEQFELKQKINEYTSQGVDCEKTKIKVITGKDILPDECVEMYGKLASNLMFRQNNELLISLQKNLEENCLVMLEENFVSPSIIVLTEVISAILCAFFHHSKMADHTVPKNIAEDFWSTFETFELQILKRFGECVLKLSYNPPLVNAFLKLCLSYTHMKILNVRYGNIKINVHQVDHEIEVFDLSVMLPCLSAKQWTTLAERITEDEGILILNNLLIAKLIAMQITQENNLNEAMVATRSYLIKYVLTNPDILRTNNYFAKVLFTDLEKSQLKQLAKNLVKLYLNNPSMDLFRNDAVINNRALLNAVVLETARNIAKCFQRNDSLSKALGKSSFDIAAFTKDIDLKEYIEQISLIENQDDVLLNCIEIFRQINIFYLQENYQLTAIFVMLLTKKCCQSKKLRRNIDHVLQNIFELNQIHPNLYKIFPVDFIYSFKNKIILDLLTLRIKTSNHLIIVKSLLEIAVKKVKNDSEIVKNIVNLLLTTKIVKSSGIDYFGDPVFQITCLILPLIAKHKKTITASAYRSILADLQEKLHNNMLESFKNIDFKNSSLFLNETVNIDDSTSVSDNTIATLNAMEAYSLTLAKYCETTDAEEIKKLDCLWSGLDFFIQNAIKTVKNPKSKTQHVESSIQLLNVVLRYLKKLESHEIFREKDKFFVLIWQSLKARLLMLFDCRQKNKNKVNDGVLEDIAVTLKFVCELCSIDCFTRHCIDDLSVLTALKKPSAIIKNEELTNLQITSHKVSKFLCRQCLRANIVGPKCVAMTKLMSRKCKNLKFWIQQHYESEEDGEKKIKKNKIEDEFVEYPNSEIEHTVIKVDESICYLLSIELDILSEVILAAKKISLDYKFLDSIFELQHLIHYILGHSTIRLQCEISWQAFFKLFDSLTTVLNSLLVAREELLEDRWPCYMQCYRVLISCLCERSKSQIQLNKVIEDNLAEKAHCIEKLTQSICKRKTHISRLAAYTVADICSWLERTVPSRMVRQHLENSVALLIQTTDSTYAMAFLRRTLAGSPGQITITNLYSMYKRYHKYVGDA